MDSSLHPDVDVLDRPYCHLPDRCQPDQQGDRPLGIDTDLLTQLLGEQSQLYITLLGQPEDVNYEMLNLYHSGYDMDAWSEPQRIPGSVNVITAYTKRSRRQVSDR